MLLSPFPTDVWIHNRLNTQREPIILLRLDQDSGQLDLLMPKMTLASKQVGAKLCQLMGLDSSLWHVFNDPHYPDVIIVAQIDGPYCDLVSREVLPNTAHFSYWR